jgi:hypothetical protein
MISKRGRISDLGAAFVQPSKGEAPMQDSATQNATSAPMASLVAMNGTMSRSDEGFQTAGACVFTADRALDQANVRRARWVFRGIS